MRKTFVGFGFGPIQSGLFLYEAYQSGKFDRLVVAEVAEHIVGSLRGSDGNYAVNIAGKDGVAVQKVAGIEVLNPYIPVDQQRLIAVISECDEVATALPSVEFFDRGQPSPAALLAHGLLQRMKQSDSRQTLVYAAENHNHAAEMLRNSVRSHFPKAAWPWLDEHVQFVNTVIGKMSGIVDDPTEIAQAGLQPVVRGGTQAILVEEFNSILIEHIRLAEFTRGIEVFEEKAQLLPFEEAKLYGHNAAHALLGYLAHRDGLSFMSEAKGEPLMQVVAEAFLEESGVPLCQKHTGLDPLFTKVGWREYTTELLQRMTNPYLRDRVDRVIRDPMRKLGWNDRLIGCIRLGLQYGVQPQRYLKGAAAALEMLMGDLGPDRARQVLSECWNDAEAAKEEKEYVAALVMQVYSNLSHTALSKPGSSSNLI